MSICVNITMSVGQWRCVHKVTCFRFHLITEAIIYKRIASQMAARAGCGKIAERSALGSGNF